MPFANHREATLELANLCNEIVRTCLRNLVNGLGSSEFSILEDDHHPDIQSDSGIKFVSAPTKPLAADMPDTTHTDTGSITLLWCEKWASQMQSRESKEWLWIEPKADCVLVNIADHVQTRTNGRLHSPVHRISQPGDGEEERLFVSYYLRPSKVN